MYEEKKSNDPLFVRAGAWALYDFANTIYSFIVVTMYLPPLLEGLTGSNFLMGTSKNLSVAKVFLPYLATRGRKKPPRLLKLGFFEVPLCPFPMFP